MDRSDSWERELGSPSHSRTLRTSRAGGLGHRAHGSVRRIGQIVTNGRADPARRTFVGAGLPPGTEARSTPWHLDGPRRWTGAGRRNRGETEAHACCRRRDRGPGPQHPDGSRTARACAGCGREPVVRARAVLVGHQRAGQRHAGGREPGLRRGRVRLRRTDDRVRRGRRRRHGGDAPVDAGGRWPRGRLRARRRGRLVPDRPVQDRRWVLPTRRGPGHRHRCGHGLEPQARGSGPCRDDHLELGHPRRGAHGPRPSGGHPAGCGGPRHRRTAPVVDGHGQRTGAGPGPHQRRRVRRRRLHLGQRRGARRPGPARRAHRCGGPAFRGPGPRQRPLPRPLRQAVPACTWVATSPRSSPARRR